MSDVSTTSPVVSNARVFKGFTREALLQQRPSLVNDTEARVVIRQSMDAFTPLMEWADNYVQAPFEDDDVEETAGMGYWMRLPKSGHLARQAFKVAFESRLRFIRIGAGHECQAKTQHPYLYAAALHFISNTLLQSMTLKTLQTAVNKNNEISPWLDEALGKAGHMACFENPPEWESIKAGLDEEIEQKVERMFGVVPSRGGPKL